MSKDLLKSEIENWLKSLKLLDQIMVANFIVEICQMHDLDATKYNLKVAEDPDPYFIKATESAFSNW